jgi:hypothetical protein
MAVDHAGQELSSLGIYHLVGGLCGHSVASAQHLFDMMVLYQQSAFIHFAFVHQHGILYQRSLMHNLGGVEDKK